jgi:proteasome assembly chaperone (PAC2) family protein
MTDDLQSLNDPWLVAMWPGLGNVALGAGAYLKEILEPESVPLGFETAGYFDLDKVAVEEGLIQPQRPPRNELLVWRNPGPGRDLILFRAEAQPDRGSSELARLLVARALSLGATQAVTFAAMLTPSAPTKAPDLLAIATDVERLEAARQAAGGTINSLQGGHLTGLNGTLLAAAAEVGLPGVCLMGEVPAVAANVPYLKTSHALLGLFSSLAEIELDLDRLAVRAKKVQRSLKDLLTRLGKQPDGSDGPKETEEGKPDWLQSSSEEGSDDQGDPEAAKATSVAPEILATIEALFLQAESDRAVAYTLKETLDAHDLFDAYEDRFLDLFKTGA